MTDHETETISFVISNRKLYRIIRDINTDLEDVPLSSALEPQILRSLKINEDDLSCLGLTTESTIQDLLDGCRQKAKISDVQKPINENQMIAVDRIIESIISYIQKKARGRGFDVDSCQLEHFQSLSVEGLDDKELIRAKKLRNRIFNALRRSNINTLTQLLNNENLYNVPDLGNLGYAFCIKLKEEYNKLEG